MTATIPPIQAFLWGLAAALVVALFVFALFLWNERDRPADEIVPPKGGFFLGMFETLIFYASFTGGGAALTIGGAWLVFKTAAKWESGKLTLQVTKLTADHLSRRYRQFLTGTAGNIVAGLTGATVAQFLRQ